MLKVKGKRAKTLATLGAIILFFDVFSKYCAYHFIPQIDWMHPSFPYGGIGVFGDFFGIDFSLNYTENRGGAWGLFANYHEQLLWIRICLVGILFVYLTLVNKDRRKQIPLILILTGAVGNILDCFIYGHVIDMLHFKFWGYTYPIFNIADVAIFLGIVGLFLLSLRKKPSAMPVITNASSTTSSAAIKINPPK